jgi:hypothetical protein
MLNMDPEQLRALEAAEESEHVRAVAGALVGDGSGDQHQHGDEQGGDGKGGASAASAVAIEAAQVWGLEKCMQDDCAQARLEYRNSAIISDFFDGYCSADACLCDLQS